jgi:hypothetical protein
MMAFIGLAAVSAAVGVVVYAAGGAAAGEAAAKYMASIA